MLEALGTRIMAGVVSLAMFLFSSYTGNDPGFARLSGVTGKNHLQLSTRLVSAFDNDFPDVFKSGSLITVNFTVRLRSRSQLVFSQNYRNTVQYDTRHGSYTVYNSALGRRQTVAAYRSMIAEISALECSIPVQQSWGTVEAEVEAWLPTVHFAQINRDVDLMVLWRLRRPSAKGSFNVRSAS